MSEMCENPKCCWLFLVLFALEFVSLWHFFSTCLMSKLKSNKSHEGRLDYKFVTGQIRWAFCALGSKLPILDVECLQPRVCKQLALIILRVKGKRKIPPSACLLAATNCSEYSYTGPRDEGRGGQQTPWWCHDADGAAGHLLLVLSPHLQLVDAPLMLQLYPHPPKAPWPFCLCSCFSWPELWMLLGVYDYYLILMSLFFP